MFDRAHGRRQPVREMLRRRDSTRPPLPENDCRGHANADKNNSSASVVAGPIRRRARPRKSFRCDGSRRFIRQVWWLVSGYTHSVVRIHSYPSLSQSHSSSDGPACSRGNQHSHQAAKPNSFTKSPARANSTESGCLSLRFFILKTHGSEWYSFIGGVRAFSLSGRPVAAVAPDSELPAL